MISYEKMLKLFEENKITSYTMKKNNIIGQATWKKIQEGGNIDMRSLDALCKYFNCQPSDLIEYIED